MKYMCRLQADIIYCEHQESVIVDEKSHLQPRLRVPCELSMKDSVSCQVFTAVFEQLFAFF